MEKMGKKPQYLMQRYHKYYIRRAVPDYLRGEIGKGEIIRPLGGDYQKALRKLSLASAEVDAEFEVARRRLGLVTAGSLDEQEVKVLALRWFRRADAGAARAKVEVGAGNGLPRAEALAQADDDLATLTDPEDPLVASAAMAEANRLMEGEGIKLNPASPEYRMLCRFITRGMAESTRRGRDRLMGDYSGRHHDAAFAGNGGEVAEVAPAPVTLGQLVERFLADPTRTTAKAEDYKTVLSYLAEFVPEEAPASRVTRDHCLQVAALLKRLPANATKKKELRGKRPMAAADEAEARGMAPMSATTANRYLGRMGTLFRFAVRGRLTDHNPAEALRLPKRVHGRDARQPFSVDQLNLIFGADIYDDAKAAWDHRHWIPLVGLFAGLRLNEIATLRCDDVEALGGVDVIRVRPDEAGVKRLKSRAAQRDVPVHAMLKKIGFLDFVKRQRADGHEVLFPDLTADKLGYFSDGYTRWFGKFLRQIGAKAPRTSFHSLRHCFRDGLGEAGVPLDRVRALGGWAGSGADAIYGNGVRAKTMAGEVAKIKYPGLDLEHLYAN